MSFARILALLLSLLMTSAAWAEAAAPTSEAKAPTAEGVVPPNESSTGMNYNVLLQTKEQRFNVGLFGQFSSFKRGGKAFTGNPFEVLAGYSITEKIGFNVNLMQALDMANGATVLYTGVRTSASYNFIGLNYSKRSTVLINGTPSVSIIPYHEPTLNADFGFDQIFFNGTSRVAPATGMSFGAQYAQMVSSYRVSAMARYGMLKVNQIPVNLMTAGVGLLYQF